MTIAKKVAKWVWTEFKKEMRYQKAERVPASFRGVKFEVQMPRKSTKGIDAIRGILMLIIAPIIFVILMLMIGF